MLSEYLPEDSQQAFIMFPIVPDDLSFIYPK